MAAIIIILLRSFLPQSLIIVEHKTQCSGFWQDVIRVCLSSHWDESECTLNRNRTWQVHVFEAIHDAYNQVNYAYYLQETAKRD